MKAVVAALQPEKALVGAFSVIVQQVVEPMDRFAALVSAYLLTVTFVPGRGWVVRPARAESGEIRAHSARKSKSSREIAN